MSESKQNHSQHGGEAGQPKTLSGGKAMLLIVLCLVVAGILAVAGIVPRLRAEKKLASDTTANAAPDVLVAKPGRGAANRTVVLPGALQAYITSPIYARTNGYLKKWYVDIGGHVKKGQLLAVIESPEIDQQLAQAQADLATAETNARNAATQGQRYQDLLQQNAVSALDRDNFVTSQLASNTQVQSARANVGHMQQLVGFERVYAPFDGVLTARDIDYGQLINSGAATSQMLFEEAQINTLRVYVSVPQIDSVGAKPGIPAQITLAEYPGRTFTGKIVRTANSIDPTTRTLLVEVDVENRDGALMPGAYGEVHLDLSTKVSSLTISASAMIFNAQGLQAAVVRDGKAYLVPIVVAQNDGKTVEVTKGLQPDDELIQNPPDSLTDGEPVHVVQPKSGGSK
jgi:RND family efflux transporter MFP subunit